MNMEFNPQRAIRERVEMPDKLDDVIRRILREYRHLMTEAERRADRAFGFSAKLPGCGDPAEAARMTAAVDDALADPEAAALHAKGRQRFLRDVAERILAQHGPILPRCDACGGVLKSPHPKQCFDCDYDQ